MKDSYTFVVMSPDNGPIRQYAVERRVFRRLIILAFIVLVGALGGIGYGVYSKGMVHSIHSKLQSANTEYELLKTKQQNWLDTLDNEMKQTRDMAEKIRHVLGISTEKGILGQGGAGLDTEEFEDIEQESILRTRSQETHSIEVSPGSTDDSATSDSRLAQILRLKNEIQPIYSHVESAVKEINEMPSILPIKVREQLLFSVRLEDPTDSTSGNISEKLRSAFKANGITISQNVSISIEKEEDQWKIDDSENNQAYVVYKAGNYLNIFPDGNEIKPYWYSSGFGWRSHPITKTRQFHRGLDISAQRGTPVLAAAHGVVSRVTRDRYLGRMIRIKHEARQMETVYGHLNKYANGIRVGKAVKRGEVIAYVGNSGVSTGPHLHYGVYHAKKRSWKNPKNYILDE